MQNRFFEFPEACSHIDRNSNIEATSAPHQATIFGDEKTH
jgi:hypothetical protein